MPRFAERFRFAELLAAVHRELLAAVYRVTRRRGFAAPVRSSPARQSPAPRMGMNPYQILRLQRSATPKEIDDAYCLMRKLSFYGTARDSLTLIDMAHQMLVDPESRRKIDRALRQEEVAAAPTAQHHGAGHRR